MKTLFFLLVSFCFTSAQNISEALKYYPLQNDDYWEYIEYIWDYINLENDSSFYLIEVTGDTILSNNKSYKILTRKNIPFDGYIFRTYERVDSETACLYRYINDTTFENNEYLCDSLLADSGDNFAGSYFAIFSDPQHPNTTCIDEYDGEVLNFKTSIKEFDDQSGIPAINYSFAKGLGYIHSLGCEFSCGEIFLRYARIDNVEYGTPILKTDDTRNDLSPNYILYSNYPNPFNPTTNIAYSIPRPGLVTIKVYDLLGNVIATLVDEEKPAGRYNIKFDGRNNASGIYFYVLNTENFIQSRKMLLLK